MSQEHFLITLKNQFDSETWPWLLSALRQDELIWECFTAGGLGARMCAEKPFGDSLTETWMWSPASLALFDLHQPLLFKTLAAQAGNGLSSAEPTMIGLPHALRSLARRTLADWESAPARTHKPERLGEAGLLALGLRERRMEKSWTKVWSELPDAALHFLPPATLACLFGILPDPVDMLASFQLPSVFEDHEFMPAEPGLRAVLAASCLLSQPLPPARLVELAVELVERLHRQTGEGTGKGWELSSAFLLALQQRHPALAAWVGEKLPEDWTTSAPLSSRSASGFDALTQMERQAILHGLRGEGSSACTLLENALAAARSIQASFAIRLAVSAGEQGSLSTALRAWRDALRAAPDSSLSAGSLALVLIDAGREEEAQAWLSGHPSALPQAHPTGRLAEALLEWKKGQVEPSRSLALELVSAHEETASQSLDERLTSSQLVRLARLLLDLDEPLAAEKVLKLALRQAPHNSQGIEYLASACLAQDQPENALGSALLVCSRPSVSPAARRILVESLEKLEQWPAALVERLEQLERSQPLGPALTNDLKDAAACALYAGQPQTTIRMAQQVAALEPQDGAAQALLGQANLALGSDQSALEHFRQATRLAPDTASHWISLAQAYHAVGQPDLMLETLRSAALVLPSAAEIQLALGQALLQHDSPTSALLHLRRAWDLAPVASGTARQTALPLGSTLFNLGHLAEARRILQTAYASAGAQPDSTLAYTLARTLLALGEPGEALPVLEAALNGGANQACVHLDLARAALALSQPAGEWESMDWNDTPSHAGEENSYRAALISQRMGYAQRALPALQRALALDPGLHEARALLAEAQAAHGDLISAAESFRRALETPIASDPAWRSRLASGLGRVSLSLGRYETAVAALDEAAHAAPENAAIQRFLAEALLAAGLEDDALNAAREARDADSNRLETLVWFADLALRIPARSSEISLRARQEALISLERALELAPERGDLWIRLALAQESASDIRSARGSFLRLAALVNSDQTPCELALNANDLLSAGQALRRMKEPAAAASLLEKINPPAEPENQDSESARDGTHTPADLHTPNPALVWTEIAASRQESGDRAGALKALKNGLAHDPQSIPMRLAQAGLLAELDQPQEALDGLELALESLTQRTDLDETMRRSQRNAIHLELARLFRQLDQLAEALKHAEAAAVLEARQPVSPTCTWEAHALAASLAHSLLLDTQARKWAAAVIEPAPVNLAVQGIETLAGQSEKTRSRAASADSLPASLRQYQCACLTAEIALDAGDPAAAALYLDMAQRLQPVGRRALAARARAARQNGDWNEARRLLAEILARASNTEPVDPDEPAQPLLAVGEAALDLGDWETSASLLDRAVSVGPHDPRARLLYVRRLVEAAEAHLLGTRLERVHQTVPAEAVSPDASAEFDEMLNLVLRQASSSGESGSAVHSAAVSWQRRGQVIFHPCAEAVQALVEAAAQAGPKDTAALVTALAEEEQFDAAAKAAQAFPNHPDVLLRMALALEEHQPRRSLGAAYRLVEHLKNEPSCDLLFTGDAHYLLARLASRAGARASDVEAARRSILTAIESVPNEPRWCALAAHIYLDSSLPTPSDLDLAVECLQEALCLEPDNQAHALALGLAHLRRADAESAAQVLQSAAEQVPGNGEIWLALARAQLMLENLDDAAVSAERSIECLPDPTPALLLRGELALQTGNARSALGRAQAVLRIHPDDTCALRMLANALQTLDRPAEALEILERAIPLAEDPLPLRLERVRLLRQAHGLPAALDALRILTQEYPTEACVLSAQASALWEAGQTEPAVAAARQALLSGGSTLPFEEQGSLHAALGRTLRRAGQLDSAVHHLSEAVRCRPQNLEYYLDLGQAHVERRQHSQALKVFRQAITLSNSDPRPYYQAGLALKESKDYLGAENMLRRAAALAPSDLSIHRQLGAVVALNLVHNRIGG